MLLIIQAFGMLAYQNHPFSRANIEITWDAPSLMLFHADKSAESYSVDACIALIYAFLSTHALGLGATVSGLLPPAVNHTRELKKMLNIPEDHRVDKLFFPFPG